MRFIFRFQKILDFKVSQEEIAQQKLAEWVQKYNHLLNQVEKVKVNQSRLRQMLLSSDQDAFGLGQELEALNQYQASLKVYAKEIEQPLEQAREEYLQAKREKETFELLRKREYEKFLYNEKKKEQAILNEYARNSFIINQKENSIE